DRTCPCPPASLPGCGCGPRALIPPEREEWEARQERKKRKDREDREVSPGQGVRRTRRTGGQRFCTRRAGLRTRRRPSRNPRNSVGACEYSSPKTASTVGRSRRRPAAAPFSVLPTRQTRS